ncbi:MAG: hypothetical protein AAGA86_12085, partial [Bacteroidota bacterium]
SIAHFYSYDSLANKKITEKIISYDKEFLERCEYVFNTDGQLVQIVRTNNDGADETQVAHTRYKNEYTQSYTLNGVLQKTIRTSLRKGKKESGEKVVLTKQFLNGKPLKAMEEIKDTKGQLISLSEFVPDPEKEERFALEATTYYTYEPSGSLSKTRTKNENTEQEKEYIYQYDGTESDNWIRQIITPDNSYTSRRISYYEIPKDEESVEEKE